MSVSSLQKQPSPKYPLIDSEAAKHYGIGELEWKRITGALGRNPTEPECAILSHLWSDKCSAKSGEMFLRTVYRDGPGVLHTASSSVGLIEIGFGEVLALKISHNNSQTPREPEIGAPGALATAVADLATVGAKPLGSAVSLAFGNSESTLAAQSVRKTIGGLSDFAHRSGMFIGGGETNFIPALEGTTLVNVAALGIAESESVQQPRKTEASDVLVYVGAKTGRDGLSGKQGENMVVSDPLLASLLAHYLNDSIRSGKVLDLISVGAGGLARSFFRIADRARRGVSVSLDNIPTVAELTPGDAILSESTERYLLVTSQEHFREISDILSAVGILATSVGEFLQTNDVEFVWQHHTMSLLPFQLGSDSGNQKVYQLSKFPPMLKRKDEDSSGRPGSLETLIEKPDEIGDLWIDILANPNVCSRKAFSDLFDESPLRSPLAAGGDASLFAIPSRGDRNRCLALTMDSNVRYCQKDPYLGAALTVAEGMRNLAVTGAAPVGAAQCLNFGNPEEYVQISGFSEVIRGISDACRFWDIPILNDAVSFHNSVHTVSIPIFPVVALVGIISDQTRTCSMNFRERGDKIFLLGETKNEIGCSEYVSYLQRAVLGMPPDIDFQRERKTAEFVCELVHSGLLASAHDLSSGGLAVALAECCLGKQDRSKSRAIGATLELAATKEKLRPDIVMFSETSGRYLLSCRPDKSEEIRTMCKKAGIPITGEGTVGGKEITLKGAANVSVSLASATQIWRGGLDFIIDEIELTRLAM